MEINEIAGVAERLIDEGVIYGATIGVIDKYGHQQVVTRGTLGTGPYTGIPLRGDEVYDLASLTKLYTTWRVLQLAKDGVISLSTPVNEIIAIEGQEITVEQLLLHNSGLSTSVRKVPNLTLEALLADLSAPNFVAAPETQTKYSDVGFMLLGKIIEQVTGNDLAHDYQDNLLKPMGLEHSGFRVPELANFTAGETFVPTEDVPARGGFLEGQVDDYKAYLLGGAAGHAGMFATIDDALKFTLHWLQADEVFSDWRDHEFGIRTLGWHYWNWGGEDNPVLKKNWLYQTGFTGTLMCLDLERQQALVVLTNRVHPQRWASSWLVDRYEFMARFFL